MNAVVLETIGLSKAFGAVVVADNISFQLQEGARHALIGPNGAGKTSFINLITGRLVPNAGQVVLKGHDITNVAPHLRVRNGLCRTFQINSLFSGLSVLKYIPQRCGARGNCVADDRAAGRYRAALSEAYDFTSRLGLEEVADRIVASPSYGQQRLVELAIALAQRPDVLLLDEPAAGVPSGESGVILDFLERLPSNLAVLLIDHDMDIVFRFAKRITVLERGRILLEAAPEEVAGNKDVQRIYFGESEISNVRDP